MTGVAPTYIYDRSQYTFERNEFVLSLERCVDIFGNLRSSASRSLISGSPVVWLINLQKDEVILEETEVRRLQISSFWTFGAFENTVKRIIIQEKWEPSGFDLWLKLFPWTLKMLRYSLYLLLNLCQSPLSLYFFLSHKMLALYLILSCLRLHQNCLWYFRCFFLSCASFANTTHSKTANQYFKSWRYTVYSCAVSVCLWCNLCSPRQKNHIMTPCSFESCRMNYAA